jgi:hypothetical protein
LANRKSGGPTLYAANFHNGTVVFDSSFHLVTGGFVDPNVPANYAPFGIASIDNLLYVTFALQNGERQKVGGGVSQTYLSLRYIAPRDFLALSRCSPTLKPSSP